MKDLRFALTYLISIACVTLVLMLWASWLVTAHAQGLAIGDTPPIGEVRFYSAETSRGVFDRGSRLILTVESSGRVVVHDRSAVQFTVSADQEKVTLSSPVYASVGVTDFRVWWLNLLREHPDRPAEIKAVYREVNAGGFVRGGKSLECVYEGPVAETLLRQLNKADLSATCPQAPNCSLERRVMKRCQDDGKLGAGAISGTPQ